MTDESSEMIQTQSEDRRTAKCCYAEGKCGMQKTQVPILLLLQTYCWDSQSCVRRACDRVICELVQFRARSVDACHRATSSGRGTQERFAMDLGRF